MAWIVWLLMFAAIEGTALFTRGYEGTLTGHIQDWFSIKDKNTGWKQRRLALLAFLVWLLTHMMGWWG